MKTVPNHCASTKKDCKRQRNHQMKPRKPVFVVDLKAG